VIGSRSGADRDRVISWPVAGKELRLPLSEWGLAARVGLFVCSLPLRLRRQTLPRLLERLASPGRPTIAGRGIEPRRAAQIVQRVCLLGVFRPPVFPKTCLRQSLALFASLSRMGHPVEIHFGIRREGEGLDGHSWISLDGRPLGERDPASDFRTIYTFAAASGRSAFPPSGEPQLT
jgi:Transglutaminase-like superfamily